MDWGVGGRVVCVCVGGGGGRGEGCKKDEKVKVGVM